jgi:hypothetical protein
VGPRRQCARVGWLGVGTPAQAAPRPASNSASSWQQYVEGPSSASVKPVAIPSASGDVLDADALLTGRGTTTLTLRPGAHTFPAILLDYGKDVGGQGYVDVASETGGPTLQGAFSEARPFLTATGDNGTLAGLRFGDAALTGNGAFLLPFEGGERFEVLTLTTPGTVHLTAAGIRFEAYRATPGQYRGHFLSSSVALNRMWYDGAYTSQLDMVHSGIDGWTRDAVLDGAKRDRDIWSADLVTEGQTIYDSLGANGSRYVQSSLAQLIDPETDTIDTTAGLRAGALFAYNYSLPYQLDAIDGVVDYYRATGNAVFARQELPALSAQMAATAASVGPDNLLITTGSGGRRNEGDGADWDIYDGGKAGAVTAYNAIYYHTLREMAYLDRSLGDVAQAVAYTAQAQALRQAINATLFDSATGAYEVSNLLPGTIAEDANAEAVLYGIAPGDRAPSILRVLRRTLWTARGSEPFSSNAHYSDIISPYANGLEVDARFAAGDTTGAMQLLQDMWGQMLNPAGAYYTGTFWEKLDPDGRPPDSETSLAHGWSTTPTSALTQYVLGAAPVAPGYATWLIKPHPGALAWAEGTVPTPRGTITVNWTQSAVQAFTLTFRTPRGTSGTVVVPASPGQAVSVDGKVAWTGARARAGHAYRSGPYVHLLDVGAGPHTVTVGGAVRPQPESR